MADKPETPIDRRKCPRVKALHLVTYVAKEGRVRKSTAAIGRTLDISPAGTRIEVYDPIDPGSDMEVEIAVDDKVISTLGKFVHSSETDDGIYVVGIEFDRAHPELFTLLEEAVDRSC